MGLMDKVGAGAGSGMRAASGDDHYQAVVNKGSLNMGKFTTELNQRWRDGWELNQVIEQDGNTVVVYSRRSAS